MAPAGAANSHRQIAAIIANKARQPVVHKTPDVIKHAVNIIVPVKIRYHGRILSRKGPQKRFIMRIGKAANIEYHVGIERNTVLEAERLEQERQACMIETDEISDPCAQ